MRPWGPPAHPPHDPGRISALSGSRLFESGRCAGEVQAVLDFLARPCPASLEIGFDHGMCLLDRARGMPDHLHLGVEIREARVQRLQPHVPRNCLAWRADARAALATVIPAGRLAAIYVLFPDPVWTEAHRQRHLLFSPAFLRLCAAALEPAGVLHVATDIHPYFEWISGLFLAASWKLAHPPPLGAELSRRDRVCTRDKIPVYRGSWTPSLPAT